jgi:hypothetical protein
VRRPGGVTALAGFFVFGTLMSGLAALALVTPGGPLEPMWRINPRAREGFATMGGWAPLLLAAVCLACASAAAGLWRGRPWGRALAIVILTVNLVGDAGNVVFGHDVRAAIGIPIAAALVAYLAWNRRVRAYFARIA